MQVYAALNNQSLSRIKDNISYKGGSNTLSLASSAPTNTTVYRQAQSVCKRFWELSTDQSQPVLDPSSDQWESRTGAALHSLGKECLQTENKLPLPPALQRIGCRQKKVYSIYMATEGSAYFDDLFVEGVLKIKKTGPDEEGGGQMLEFGEWDVSNVSSSYESFRCFC